MRFLDWLGQLSLARGSEPIFVTFNH